MLTVLIYDERISSMITEYRPFWDPFLSSGEFALCRWRTKGRTLADAVPDLYDTLGEEISWRAVVLHHSMAAVGSNPFDFFEGDESAQEVEKNDLIRLTHMLSTVPHKVQITPVGAVDKDYILDRELTFERQEEDKDYYTLGESNYEILCARPNKILLLCTRKKNLSEELYRGPKKDAKERAIRNLKGSFCDRNDYPANIRFLIYDTWYTGDTMGERDQFILMHALMTLLMNEAAVNLRAEEIYRLQVCVDEERLEQWLMLYQDKMEYIDARIRMTRMYLQEERENIREYGTLPVMDTNYYVDLAIDAPDAYEISEKSFRLYKDSPEPDEKIWERDKAASQRALDTLAKEPVRRLGYSIDEIREALKNEEQPVTGRFSREQLDDAAALMEQLERGMFQGDATPALKVNEQERAEHEETVKTRIERRMTAPMALLGLAAAVLLFAAGFLPYFMSPGVFEDLPARLMMFFFMLAGIGILFAVWLVFLMADRRRVRREVRKYNSVISKVVDSYYRLQRQYQAYVTKAFNYRKYWGFAHQLHEEDDKFYAEEASKTEINLLRHKEAVHRAMDFCARMRKAMNIQNREYDLYEPKDPPTFSETPEESGYYELNWQARRPENPWADETDIYYGYEFVRDFGVKREEWNA